jgi:predicted O-methyltransferase YrrM
MTTFTENWMSDRDIAEFHSAMRAVSAADGKVIEVGSWEGKSTIQIANFFYPQTVEVIDLWGPDSRITKEVVERGGRDVFETFRRNMDAETKGNYRVHRMNWRDYLFVDPIRFIFIDADHSYSEVRDGINAVKHLIVSGGVIAGDDIQLKSVRDAVRDSLGSPAMTNGKVWWMKRRCSHETLVQGQNSVHVENTVG